jgi:hypothetical protein
MNPLVLMWIRERAMPDEGALSRRDEIALAMMAQGDPWAGAPLSENVETGDPLPLTGFERFGIRGWPYEMEGVVPPDSSQFTGLGGELGNQNIALETLDNIYVNNVYDRDLNPDPTPYQTPDPNDPMSDFTIYSNITPTVPPGTEEATVVPGSDAPWQTVAPPQAGYFEGSSPYDNAGASGIPGSYGAPGPFGGHRRGGL